VKPPELLVIRHGESEWNTRGLWQGHADPPLSPAGRAQALDLVRSLAGEPIDRIESSDLQRARQTAEPLATDRGLALRTDPLYRELDAGQWSGLTREEIAARGEEVFPRFQSGSPDAAPPGGESRRQLWERVRRALEALCERSRGERVAVVTHGGFVRACFPRLDVPNASIHRAPADVLLARVERALSAAP